MNRRSVLAGAVAAGAGLAAMRTGAGARQATPAADDAAILTIRWELQRINSGERVTEPDDPANYWFQLLPDGSIVLRADCNRGRGGYALEDSSLTFGELATTKVACGPESIGEEFTRQLGYVVSYVRTGELSDELVLSLMADGGELIFAPSLRGVVWQWVRFEGGDGSVVEAADHSRYTIEFLDDGSVRVLADCNRGNGTAKLDAGSIDLTVATTRMACPGDSQDAVFLRYLDEAVTYLIRDGQLALSLPMDSGIAFFRPLVPETLPATPTS
jgi:heat shock protein HslJ